MGTPEPEVAYAEVFNGRSSSCNHNDFKPFSEVIKIETEFSTSKCVKQEYLVLLKNRFFLLRVFFIVFFFCFFLIFSYVVDHYS